MEGAAGSGVLSGGGGGWCSGKGDMKASFIAFSVILTTACMSGKCILLFDPDQNRAVNSNIMNSNGF